MLNQYPLESVDLFAAAIVGNWKRFDSFAWHGAHDLDDPDQWAIIYTSNRDSTLIDQSNAAQIDLAMQPHLASGQARSERHNHWAVGYVDGYSVRVYDANGKPTDAIATIYQIAIDLDQYPILSETDYSDREFEATIDNVSDCLSTYMRRHDLDLDIDLLVSEIVRYFDRTDSTALESVDDQGAYPTDEQIDRAMHDLGYVLAD